MYSIRNIETVDERLMQALNTVKHYDYLATGEQGQRLNQCSKQALSSIREYFSRIRTRVCNEEFPGAGAIIRIIKRTGVCYECQMVAGSFSDRLPLYAQQVGVKDMALIAKQVELKVNNLKVRTVATGDVFKIIIDPKELPTTKDGELIEYTSFTCKAPSDFSAAPNTGAYIKTLKGVISMRTHRQHHLWAERITRDGSVYLFSDDRITNRNYHLEYGRMIFQGTPSRPFLVLSKNAKGVHAVKKAMYQLVSTYGLEATYGNSIVAEELFGLIFIQPKLVKITDPIEHGNWYCGLNGCEWSVPYKGRICIPAGRGSSILDHLEHARLEGTL